MFDEQEQSTTPEQVYIVKARLMITPYMNDSRYEDIQRVVYAQSAREAEEKLEAYYRAKSDQYGDAMYIMNCDTDEPIR